MKSLINIRLLKPREYSRENSREAVLLEVEEVVKKVQYIKPPYLFFLKAKKYIVRVREFNLPIPKKIQSNWVRFALASKVSLIFLLGVARTLIELFTYFGKS